MSEGQEPPTGGAHRLRIKRAWDGIEWVWVGTCQCHALFASHIGPEDVADVHYWHLLDPAVLTEPVFLNGIGLRASHR